MNIINSNNYIYICIFCKVYYSILLSINVRVDITVIAKLSAFHSLERTKEDIDQYGCGSTCSYIRCHRLHEHHSPICKHFVRQENLKVEQAPLRSRRICRVLGTSCGAPSSRSGTEHRVLQ